jgi:hypothetical protein
VLDSSSRSGGGSRDGKGPSLLSAEGASEERRDESRRGSHVAVNNRYPWGTQGRTIKAGCGRCRVDFKVQGVKDRRCHWPIGSVAWYIVLVVRVH